MNELNNIINQKEVLLAREFISRPAISFDKDMPENQKDRFIEYLIERDQKRNSVLEQLLAQMKDIQKIAETAQQASEEIREKFHTVNSQNERLVKELKRRDGELKRKDQEIRKLKEQLKFARQNQFGDKRQKISKDKAKEPEADRQDEKDHFDGTGNSLSTKSVEAKVEEPEQPSPKKERDLTNRPDKYKKMGVESNVTVHPSDKSKVPGEVIETKEIKLFSLSMTLREERYELVHYRDADHKLKWAYFPSEGHPQSIPRFDGTKATPEFLQAIAYEVYVKNVTFGLLHQWLCDMGMTISKNTLRNWIIKGKKYLDRLVLALKEVALKKDSIVNCDETWCKVRKYDRYKKCYIWVLVNKAERTVIFFYEDGSRGRNVLTNFLGDAELKSIMSDGYNAYVFIGDELKSEQFKETVHQVDLAHGRAKFVKAAEQGGEKAAKTIVDDINLLFDLERKYNKEKISPEERTKRRQSLETKEILIRLRSKLTTELDKQDIPRSEYFTEALNYMDRFWKEMFAFLEDGSLPIDNNLAERNIRKLTTQRNNMVHFGSDEGVETAVVYHSVISTLKLMGKSVWNSFGEFFKNIVNGCSNFIGSTLPGVTLADANS